MKVQLLTSDCDTSTLVVAADLCTFFNVLACKIEDDYDGKMDHLWIDFELSEMKMKLSKKLSE